MSKDLKKIRETAEEYYRNGDFYCSEAVVKTLKDEFMPEMSDDVVKMASGFPVGIGGAGCTCGALTGGILALGMVFGRNKAKGEESAKALELSNELYERFIQMNKCSCCKVLIKGMVKGSEEHMNQCIRFTGDMAEEGAKIIIREKGL